MSSPEPNPSSKQSQPIAEESPRSDTIATTLDHAITSKGSAEVAVRYLLDHYNVNPDHIRRLWEQDSLSRVALDAVTPSSDSDLKDAATFEMHRARLPVFLVNFMNHNLLSFAWQYGAPSYQNDTTVISRSLLAPLFGESVGLFRTAMRDRPESSIYGLMQPAFSVPFRFVALCMFVVLIVQVKPGLEPIEWLNAIVRVMAEVNSCDQLNNTAEYRLPIYAILSDGYSFQFFRFDRKTNPFSFERGAFPNPTGPKPRYTLKVPLDAGSSFKHALPHFRPIAESIYYLLLLGYEASVKVHLDKAKEVPRLQEDVGKLEAALQLASEALKKVTEGDGCRVNKDFVTTDIHAVEAAATLKKSVMALPEKYRFDESDAEEWLSDPKMHSL